MDGRVDSIDPVIDLHLGKFDNQDGILRRQTDERNQPDLEVNIVFQAGRPNPQVGSQRRHRQRQQDSNRHNPTLVLRSQEEEDEEENQRQHKARLSAGFLFLIRQTAPLNADVIREVVFGDTFHRSHSLTGTVSRSSYRIDGCRGKHIESLDSTRASRVLCRPESRQRNHRSILCPDKEQPDIVLSCTVRCLRLDINAINTVEHIEVVHIDRTQISLHRCEDIRQRNT